MGIQAKRVEELRRSWGDKLCTHPDADKEYDLGGQTGDYACTTCGDTWWGRDGWQAARKRALETFGGERP